MGKSTCATNETVIKHVPDDLALSILSKMPVKSLKRFGCLRKSWGPLFENSYFMRVYRHNFISSHHTYYDDTSVLLQVSIDDFYSLSGEKYENVVKLDWPNPFEQENPKFEILDSGSISGILCLYYRPETVVFWNPTTDEFKVLPSSPLESVPPYQRFMVDIHGFGYDHIRDDYNLIRTITYFSPSSFDCEQLGMSLGDVVWEDISDGTLWEIYSLRSNSWRKLDVDDSVVRLISTAIGQRLYLDGICHWWNHNYKYPPYYEEKTLISFELVNEVFYTTPIPLDISPLDERDAWRYMVVLNESVALISWYDCSTTFDILILGERGVKESWTKIFTIGPLSCVERPIGTGTKGDIFFTKNDGEIVWFDLGSQNIEELGVQGFLGSHILIYKENLLPMEGKSLI